MRDNLILIGMPASGKSTLGVMAAKALGWGFLDTDVHIQTREDRTLKQIIRVEGVDAFRRLETCHVCALDVDRCVVATGGSVVYGPEAMAHLGWLGHIVWLQVGLAELERRIGDLVERGVIHRPGQALVDLLKERETLYRRYAQTTLDCDGKDPEQVVRDLQACVQRIIE